LTREPRADGRRAPAVRGGIRGGQIYGSTDKQAAYVKENPVSPDDFLATIHHAVGVSAEMEIHDREGRPHRLVEGRPVTGLFLA